MHASHVAFLLLFSAAVISSEAKVTCDKIKSPRRCEKRPECEYDYRGGACSRTPTAPPPPVNSCEGSRRRKCMHKHSPKQGTGSSRYYNALCSWNKATKNCDTVPLCREEGSLAGYWSTNPTAVWMAQSLFFCVPDCQDNPVHQFLPKEANNAGAAGIDASYELWGIDPWDPTQWCPAMYGDLVRGKEAPEGSLWTTRMIGLALNSCDNPPRTILTDWVMGWQTDMAPTYTGNVVCCETCGTCQTEKFRCNRVAEDDDRGNFPCGSDAWGFKETKFLRSDRCFVGDPAIENGWVVGG